MVKDSMPQDGNSLGRVGFCCDRLGEAMDNGMQSVQEGRMLCNWQIPVASNAKETSATISRVLIFQRINASPEMGLDCMQDIMSGAHF